jgi:hypothetical protein
MNDNLLCVVLEIFYLAEMGWGGFDWIGLAQDKESGKLL